MPCCPGHSAARSPTSPEPGALASARGRITEHEKKGTCLGWHDDASGEGGTIRRGEKRSRLEGGALSDEVIDSSASVYERRGARAQAGLQQFFSPPEASQLAYRVFAH